MESTCGDEEALGVGSFFRGFVFVFFGMLNLCNGFSHSGSRHCSFDL